MNYMQNFEIQISDCALFDLTRIRQVTSILITDPYNKNQTFSKDSETSKRTEKIEGTKIQKEREEQEQKRSKRDHLRPYSERKGTKRQYRRDQERVRASPQGNEKSEFKI